ncbi:phage holin family protein [Oscillospiraceae bacterium MB08-C2-2]|nr:phage holin family protein [Oscillospiraceae bacterium MB08-C2-2]
MVDLTQFIHPELLILVPVLYIIGHFLKKSSFLPDHYIPLALGAAGIVLSLLRVLSTESITGWQQGIAAVFNGIVQGILCAGASVYANQLIRQQEKGKEEQKK